MIPTFLRFADLKARGIVASWAQLAKLQEKHGFPSGRRISPNIRVWTEAEIAAWLESRPTDKAQRKGFARGGAHAPRAA